MSAVKTWASKDEVLRDLARASGMSYRRDDLDEDYIVIGDAPPPVFRENTDDERALLFGDVIDTRGMPSEMKPDLKGIQQMLRMEEESRVDESLNNTFCGPIQITKPKPTKKVSKLNPNVKEFIPKSSKTSSIPGSSSENIDNNKENVCTQPQVTEETKNVSQDSENDEYQNIAKKLKNTISDAAKSDSFQQKETKIVAIASLLKLIANKAEPVQLKKPEDFMSETPEVSTKPEHVAKPEFPVKPESPKNEVIQVPGTSSSSSSSLFEDPEVKRSIEKVNRWLGEPEKRVTKTPAVCLEPVTFRRKGPASSKSPSISEPNNKEKKINTGKQYVPSSFAADLSKKYEMRNKEIESMKKANLWENLDQVLKEKDREIMKRLEQARQSNDSSPQH